MATVTFYLDTRHKSAAGGFPLKLAINHGCNTAYIPLNLHLNITQWDKSRQRITEHTRRAALNTYIQTMRLNAETAMLQIQQESGLRRFSARNLRNMIVDRLSRENAANADETARNKDSVEAMFEYMIEDATKSASTRNLYRNVLTSLKRFDKNFSQRRYEDISREYLLRFYGDLIGRISQNSAFIYMSKFMAVFNRAVDDELTVHYPFRRLTFRRQTTRKRALSVALLRELLRAELPEKQGKARDMFALTVFLLGINIGDLCRLKGISSDGYIEYRRSKTSKLFRIKVEDEARAIISRYPGKMHLIDLIEQHGNKTNANIWVNRHLDGICELLPELPHITTYWARHTWATIAASIDVPKETISRALGHSFGSAITDVYIDYDTRKVEQANRQVIDYIFSDDAK